MKKLCIAIVLCLCLGTASVFADHPSNTLGLGALFRGGGGGDGWNGLDLGASVKMPVLPLFWGFFFKVGDGYVGLGATADYYFLDLNLVKDQNVNLDWYLGLGAYGDLAGFDDELIFAGGGRVPVGLSWHINQDWEIFLGVAANLGLQILPDFHFPQFFMNAELGFRYWF
jgi:hypothetical protein